MAFSATNIIFHFWLQVTYAILWTVQMPAISQQYINLLNHNNDYNGSLYPHNSLDLFLASTNSGTIYMNLQRKIREKQLIVNNLFIPPVYGTG